jgi:uncharacterized protein HemX
MAVQEKFNTLKAGPKEDKVAVASGIAVAVVVVLLAAWAIYFFHKIQTGAQQVNLSGAGDQFAPADVTAAQQQLEQQFGSPTQGYQDIQSESAAGNSGQMQTVPMQVQGDQSDQFGTQGSGQ